MKKFKYRAKRQSGETVTGIVEAADKRQAVGLLREKDLVVVGISDAERGLASVNSLLNRVSLGDLANFTRQLSTMITAGMNLVDALGILQNQTEGYLSRVLADVRRSVEGGKSLSESMKAYPKVFNTVYVSLITAGEKAGVLDKVLQRLADNLEAEREFRAKVKGALMYPVIVLIGMVVVFFVMVFYVIPQLSGIYQDFEADLPGMTQALLDISAFSQNYWWLLIGGGVGVVMLYRFLYRVPDWRKRIEQIKLSLPIFGALYEEVLMAELTRTMSLLVAAGVPIVEALQLVAEGADNLLYKEGILRARMMVERGYSLAQAFGREAIFPAIFAQMLSVGEETGQVDQIMMRVSNYFDTESREKVKGLTSAIEPFIIILLAIGVGFLVFAIVIPIYNLTNQL